MNNTNVLRIGEFYGGCTSWRVRDAVLTEVAHDRARSVPEHAHEAPYFCLLLGGAYSERAGSVQIAYRPMTLTYHPAALPHADEIGEGGARFFMVELNRSWLPVIEALDATHSHLTELHETDALWVALRLHRTVAAGGAGFEIVASSLLHELVGYAAPPQPLTAQEPAWLAVVERTLHERFAEDLDLNALGALVGVHPGHVARVFRRHRGRSVGAFAIHLRVREACRRLSDTTDPLRDIAAATGFADQSHLTRALRAHLGTSPGRYRKTLLA